MSNIVLRLISRPAFRLSFCEGQG